MRAQAPSFTMWCVTRYPIHHIYRKTDLKNLEMPEIVEIAGRRRSVGLT